MNEHLHEIELTLRSGVKVVFEVGGDPDDCRRRLNTEHLSPVEN